MSLNRKIQTHSTVSHKKASAKHLKHWRLVQTDFLPVCLSLCLTIQTEGQSYQSRAFTQSAQHIYMCVSAVTIMWERVWSTSQGQVNQPSDQSSPYFCIICLQVAKQPLFNNDKTEHEGRGMTTDDYLCVKGYKPKDDHSFIFIFNHSVYF